MGYASQFEDDQEKFSERLYELENRASTSPPASARLDDESARRLKSDAVALIADMRKIHEAWWRELELATNPRVDLARENAALRHRCDELASSLSAERAAKRPGARPTA